MFDLDSGVDFDEVELVGIGIEQERDGTCALVTDIASDRQSSFVKFGSDFFA